MFAVISDIHSNLLALESVLEQIRDDGIDVVYCLGDVVGYGAEPNECTDLVRGVANGRTIKGNHDIAAYVVDPEYWENFNPQAAEAVYYQKRTLTAENRLWLENLPDYLYEEDCLFYHGSPLGPEHYLMNIGDLELAIQEVDPGVHYKLMFVGHTHLPTAVGIAESGTVEVDIKTRTRNTTDVTLYIEEGRRYLVNPGSVGQPRDKNPEASYVVVDLESNTVRFRRKSYDVAEAQRRIIAAGLPKFLSKRLELGV